MNTNSDNCYTPRTLNLDTVLGPGAKQSHSQLKLAIVGAGSMGAEHIETAYSVGRAKVVGLYDPYPACIEYAKSMMPEADRKCVKVYDSVKDAGADPDVDAIIIASPNYLHHENVRELLPFKKHILCEKPMTHNLKDALSVLRMTENYEKVFYVGFEYREKAVFKEADYLIKERKDVGDIKMMYIQEHRVPFLEKWNHWNKFADKSGGTLIEKCCHYFDLFNWYAQSLPVKVYASGGMDVNFKHFKCGEDKADMIDNAFVVIDYENGIRACVNINMFVWKAEVAEYMTINGCDGTIYLKGSPLDEIYVGSLGDRPVRRYRLELPPHVKNTGTHGGSTYFEHVNYYNAILGIEDLSVGAREGMWAVAVGQAAEMSAKSGMPIFMKDLVGDDMR